MYRFIKLPYLIFDEDVEQPIAAAGVVDVNIQEVYNTVAQKHCILTEEMISSITSILPLYPFDAHRGDETKNFQNISVIEFTRVYDTGLISSKIGNINMSPLEIIELINTTIKGWQEDDFNEHIKFQEAFEEEMKAMEELEKPIKPIKAVKKKPKTPPPSTLPSSNIF